jgi:hypothetical protein
MFECKVLIGPIATDRLYEDGEIVLLDDKDANFLAGMKLVQIQKEVVTKFMTPVDVAEAPAIDTVPVDLAEAPAIETAPVDVAEAPAIDTVPVDVAEAPAIDTARVDVAEAPAIETEFDSTKATKGKSK